MHQVRGFAAGGHHLVEQGAGAFGHLHAGTGDRTDLLGRDARAFGQLAHFCSHHREALAVLAGTGGFNGCVERQQVGLVRNVVDDADLVGDLAHGSHGLFHRLTAVFGILRRAAGDIVSHTRVFGVLCHRRGDLFDRRAGFLNRDGLLCRVLVERLRGRGEFFGCCGDRVGRTAYLGHHVLQLGDHLLHGRHHAAGVAWTQHHLSGQVATRDAGGHIGRVVRFATQLAHQAARDPERGAGSQRDQ